MILNQNGGITLPTLSNIGSAADLRSGKQLIGSDGEIVTGTMQTRTLPTPTITANSTGTITANVNLGYSGYLTNGSKSATLKLSSAHDSNFIASNIKKGVSIFGVTGTLETGTAAIKETVREENIFVSSSYFVLQLSKPCKELLAISGQIRGDSGDDWILGYPDGNASWDEIYWSNEDGAPSGSDDTYSISGNEIRINVGSICDDISGTSSRAYVHVIYVPG